MKKKRREKYRYKTRIADHYLWSYKDIGFTFTYYGKLYELDTVLVDLGINPNRCSTNHEMLTGKGRWILSHSGNPHKEGHGGTRRFEVWMSYAAFNDPDVFKHLITLKCFKVIEYSKLVNDPETFMFTKMLEVQ